MFNQKWRRILQREVIIFGVCFVIGLGLAIMGRINGNKGSIFSFTIVAVFVILYFLVQSVRAIGWSILNLMRH